MIQNRMQLCQQKFFDHLGRRSSRSHHPFLEIGSNSDFIITHLILTSLSLSPSCRWPVPLKEGPLFIQHQGRGLRDQAPLRLLQGEPIDQRVLPVRAGGFAHQLEPQPPPIHQCRPCICQGDGRACLLRDSRNGNRPRDAGDQGLLAAARCLHRGLPSHAPYFKSNDGPGRIFSVCDHDDQ